MRKLGTIWLAGSLALTLGSVASGAQSGEYQECRSQGFSRGDWEAIGQPALAAMRDCERRILAALKPEIRRVLGGRKIDRLDWVGQPECRGVYGIYGWELTSLHSDYAQKVSAASDKVEAELEWRSGFHHRLERRVRVETRGEKRDPFGRVIQPGKRFEVTESRIASSIWFRLAAESGAEKLLDQAALYRIFLEESLQGTPFKGGLLECGAALPPQERALD